MRTGFVSLIMLGGAFALFFWKLRAGGTLPEARTLVVNVIVAVEIAYLLNCRSLNHSPFAIGFSKNRWVLGGAAAMLVAQASFTYAPPMNRLFHTAPIGPNDWLLVATVAAAAFAAVELEKWIRFGNGRGKNLLPE